MAPNSNMAMRWPGGFGNVVSTSKNAVSNLSCLGSIVQIIYELNFSSSLRLRKNVSADFD